MASESVQQHQAESPDSLRCAVITVSDTRTMETDRGGALLASLMAEDGHRVVARQIIPDEPKAMTALVADLVARADVDAILLTGGTGISARDQTFETVTSLLTKPLPGYGELFRYLSYDEIGSASMLSRAVGGLIENTVVLTMPGSTAAVQLAVTKLILPELGHLVREATK
jgi:molybdenum cofactor biosynthesis protein B